MALKQNQFIFEIGNFVLKSESKSHFVLINGRFYRLFSLVFILISYWKINLINLKNKNYDYSNI